MAPHHQAINQPFHANEEAHSHFTTRSFVSSLGRQKPIYYSVRPSCGNWSTMK
ncbi:unnamed protein product, partial [Nesidiocoris tenuis]